MKSEAAREITHAVLLPGIVLASFSALLLELALTRLFSVVLFYHFAFLAISIALLGLGTGGVFAHIWKPRLDRVELHTLAASCNLLNALLIPFVLVMVLRVPVSLNLTGRNFIHLSVIYLCSAIPFFLAGLQLSVIFARESNHVSTLYAADLTGGAIACLAIVPLLNGVGAPNAILFAAIASAAAGALWLQSASWRGRAISLGTVLAALIIVNSYTHVIDVVWAKGVRRKNVEFASWNAISRVEVDRQDDGARVVVIDADANTYIMNADPAHLGASPWEHQLMASPPAIVNVLRPNGEYAIIGPGGGVDVLRAVANGSPSVTGIEINPIIANTIMRRRYADFAFHLYDRPDVHIHVSDGRSFIRSTPAQFDVVEMTLVDTWASTAAGAFALSENNLYTTEAFREYFQHLKPDGVVAVTRWEFQQPREALRVASVAMNALHQLGFGDPADQFMVISQDELNEDGIHVAVLAKKAPFSAEDERRVRQYVEANPPMRVLYSPEGSEDNAFSKLIKGNDPYSFSENYPYNVSPVTDSAPFFFFTLKPGQILHLHTRHSMDWKVNLGVAVLAMLLVISLLAVLLFLIVPLALQKCTAAAPVSALLYFVSIGLGYILVEVTFIQRFVLFLGHPTYALTVVVFLMLLSSGFGSAMSRKLIAQPVRIWLPLAAIAAVAAVYVRMLPSLLDRFVGLPFPGKLAISALLLAPLGFIMGMPFPTGLRALAQFSAREVNSIEWAWAMNAAASVLGSVLAIVIAIQFGLNATLISGAAAYICALLLCQKLLGVRSTA